VETREILEGNEKGGGGGAFQIEIFYGMEKTFDILNLSDRNKYSQKVSAIPISD